MTYDPAAAKKLLAEAGYPNGFDIQLDCPNNRYINDEAICQAVVGMLAKIGVKVTLSAIPKTIHFPKIKNRETDFYMLGWGVPTLDSHYVFSFLTKGADKGWNGTGFNDPEINKAIDQIEIETDFGKRDALINKVWKQDEGQRQLSAAPSPGDRLGDERQDRRPDRCRRWCPFHLHQVQKVTTGLLAIG